MVDVGFLKKFENVLFCFEEFVSGVIFVDLIYEFLREDVVSI